MEVVVPLAYQLANKVGDYTWEFAQAEARIVEVADSGHSRDFAGKILNLIPLGIQMTCLDIKLMLWWYWIIWPNWKMLTSMSICLLAG
jgi:hypothetical protein